MRGVATYDGKTTFEVRVRTKSDKPIGFDSFHGEFIFRKILKMFHIDANKPGQAIEKAKRYGDVVSCRKVSVAEALCAIENLDLTQKPAYGKGSPYPSAVAMDEMVWKKQKRMKNHHKDKKNY